MRVNLVRTTKAEERGVSKRKKALVGDVYHKDTHTIQKT